MPTAGTIASFVPDWRPNHLPQPGGHPDARFHGALLLLFLAGTSSTAFGLAIYAGALIAGGAESAHRATVVIEVHHGFFAIHRRGGIEGGQRGQRLLG